MAPSPSPSARAQWLLEWAPSREPRAKLGQDLLCRLFGEF